MPDPKQYLKGIVSKSNNKVGKLAKRILYLIGKYISYLTPLSNLSQEVTMKCDR